jgi:hypothetical protein
MEFSQPSLNSLRDDKRISKNGYTFKNSRGRLLNLFPAAVSHHFQKVQLPVVCRAVFKPCLTTALASGACEKGWHSSALAHDS